MSESEQHSNQNSTTLSYQDLKKKYQDLQLRITRFSVIEQQLINARNRLDKEVIIHRRLQAFNGRAFEEMSDEAYARLVAESLLDIFEVEIGFACFKNIGTNHSQFQAMEGFHLDEEHKAGFEESLKEVYASQPSGKVLLMEAMGANPIRSFVPVRSFMTTRVVDSEMNITITLLAGITDRGMKLYDAIDQDREAAFAVFAQQVLAHQTNRFKTQTIRKQYQTLSEERKRLTRIAENFLDFDTDPEQNVDRLMALSTELLSGEKAAYEKIGASGIKLAGYKEAESKKKWLNESGGFLQLIQSSETETVFLPGLEHKKNLLPEWVHELKANSMLGSMVLMNKEPIGALAVFFKNQPDLSQSDLQLIKILSAAIAVEERRQQALTALTDSEEKYRMIFEGTSNGILVARTDTLNFVFANTSSCQMLGYTTDELLALNISAIHPTRTETLIKNNLTNMATGQQVVVREVSCIRKDGTEFFADISTHKLIIGGISLVASFYTDITDRRHARQVLEKNNIELKKINSELDNFVYSVSHDLRAPLLAIRGLVTLIEGSQEFTEESVMYLNMVTHSINRMDDTIKEILEYSRNARLEIKKEPIFFRAIIMEAFDDVKHFYPEKVELMYEADETTPFYSDSYRINTLVKNMIGNAVKYKKHDDTASYLKIRFKVNKEVATIEFEDNGEGISPEHIDKIFNMFYRASNSTVGTGLGLYICKEIVDNLGGCISVKSTKGVGTTFTVTLKNL